MMGLRSARASSVSSSVLQLPLALFFALGSSLSFSKMTSPTCLGDETLSPGSPASSRTCASRSCVERRRAAAKSFSEATSTLTPVLSILARTRISGSSISS